MQSFRTSVWPGRQSRKHKLFIVAFVAFKKQTHWIDAGTINLNNPCLISAGSFDIKMVPWWKVEIENIWFQIALWFAFNFLLLSEAAALYQAVYCKLKFAENGTNLQIPVRFGRVPSPAMSYCVWVCAVAKSRWLFWFQCRLAKLVTTCKIFSNENPNTLLVIVMYTSLMRISSFILKHQFYGQGDGFTEPSSVATF